MDKKLTKKLITVEISLTQKEVQSLKAIKFKALEGDKNIQDSEIWIDEDSKSQKNFADKMVGIGIFQEPVTSWGYQETGFYLTKIGKQILTKI